MNELIPVGASIFGSEQTWRYWQEIAAFFAESQLVPKHLRGRVADVLIGLDIAQRSGMAPLQVLQSLVVINGTPGWTGKFLGASAQRAGYSIRFEARAESDRPIKYRQTYSDNGNRRERDAEVPDIAVRCGLQRQGWAEPSWSTWVTSKRAVLAGWANNVQYNHSCEVMLRWRALSEAVRFVAPHVLYGMEVADEIAEVTVIEPPPTAGPAPAKKKGADAIDAIVQPVPVSPPPSAGAISTDTDRSTSSPSTEGDTGWVDPEAERRAKLVESVRLLLAQVPAEVADRLRREAELRQIKPKTVDLAKLSRLHAALQAEIAKESKAEKIARAVGTTSEDSGDSDASFASAVDMVSNTLGAVLAAEPTPVEFILDRARRLEKQILEEGGGPEEVALMRSTCDIPERLEDASIPQVTEYVSTLEEALRDESL